MILYIFILFILGTIFGSFSSVLVSRWKNKQSGIFLGRSECPKCKHILWWLELIPIFSYLFQKGKCKNCSIKISKFYPFCEILMGIIFVIIFLANYKLGITVFDISFWITLFFGFVIWVYTLYDLKYMEIPMQIMIPALLVVFGSFIYWYLSKNYSIFFEFHTFPTFPTFEIFLKNHLFWGLYLYTFIYLQILISGSLFLIRKKRYKEIFWLVLFYVSFFWDCFLDFFRPSKEEKKNDPEEEIETWVGAGDMMIAVFSGLTLGIIHGIASFFIAYILGSLIGIIYLIICKIQKKKSNHQIPFGPFLWAGWLMSFFFYSEILEFVRILFFIG